MAIVRHAVCDQHGGTHGVDIRLMSVMRPLLPPPSHTTAHWARVRDEVTRLCDEVPLYQKAARPAPAESDAASVSAWLAEMPTTTKRDLRRGFPKSLVRNGCDLKAEMAAGKVEIIATSGTTDDRLQVLWEWVWWDPQEREAMRLNARVRETMRESFREAVLTTPVCGGSVCHIGNLSREERTIDGMLFLNQTADPTHFTAVELDRMAAEWNDLRPDGVEADPAYLAALSRHVFVRGGRLHSPAFVTLTYEQATRAHRRAIGRVIDSPLFSLYGATEAGVLFMECTAGRLHHNSAHSHVELLDLGGGRGRVVVTTLGRAWMPLLRYELGDAVRVAEGPCACGLPESGFQLARVEGRGDDCIGAVTPAMIDDCVDAAEPVVEGWQLARDGSGWILRVVGSDGARAAAAVSSLIDAPVVPRVEAALLPEGSGKYRLVKP
jgi:phenylacetate-coenzyme A ligase PaaK-like adenylate-forming protein